MSKLEPKELRLKNGQKIIIRPAQPEDAQNLLDYTKTIFEDDRFFPTTLNDLKDELTLEKMHKRIEKHHGKPGNIQFLAECDSAILGQIEITNGKSKRTQHVGYLGLNVSKEYRNVGTGTTLMQTLIEWAKNDDLIEKLSLGVFATNHRAINLYKKLGFTEEGRRPKEVKIDSEKYIDVILMYQFI